MTMQAPSTLKSYLAGMIYGMIGGALIASAVWALIC